MLVPHRGRPPCPIRRAPSGCPSIAPPRLPVRSRSLARLEHTPEPRHGPKHSQPLAGTLFCLGWIVQTDLRRRPPSRSCATAVRRKLRKLRASAAHGPPLTVATPSRHSASVPLVSYGPCAAPSSKTRPTPLRPIFRFGSTNTLSPSISCQPVRCTTVHAPIRLHARKGSWQIRVAGSGQFATRRPRAARKSSQVALQCFVQRRIFHAPDRPDPASAENVPRLSPVADRAHAPGSRTARTPARFQTNCHHGHASIRYARPSASIVNLPNEM